MKIAIILALGCSLLTGCRTGDSAASRVPATPESVAKRVEQLNLQHGRVEQLAAQSPLGSPDLLRQIHIGRVTWTNYLHAEEEQHALFVANGVVLDEEYYRLQEELLEAFAGQLRQIEDMLVKAP